MPSSVLAFSPDDRAILVPWPRPSSMPAGHAERPRMRLAPAAGAGTSGAASLVGVPQPAAILAESLEPPC
ncbi:hypothetical protein FZI85_12250 [Mycobacterium sp. CBMA293]|uniref:hypothetical protein n=1 Tax=unclassified Mycolicibacterium TaxID=2636767 RepID=UPI0012DE73CE|nr:MULTISPECIES: hypothetical protein [unclassified Mycolicibacterium]MUL47847.1 hypothetical protein [Mycolicibacterium sp. CBMA 360]MUL59306.1 hypothetical protein [Mycolicibacterium sp. CBMA 335]MUL71031.1 hypothetical protein [Mycolicibacterium sp. CBMA 311]MUL94674.1 hypothetical protein [Mycolicibacterium sp. CBMA 230]MUM11794.1 hypothetical protein [Mycolicibacterium sp. CBMA 293]